MDADAGYADWRRRRAAADLLSRSRAGPPFYLFGTLVVAWAGGFSATLAPPLIVAALAFCVLWLLRERNRLPGPADDAVAFALWTRRHFRLLAANMLIWSVLVIAVGLAERGPTQAMIVGLFLAVAFLSATAANIHTDAVEQRRLVFCLLPPAGIGFIESGLLTLAVSYGVYWLYALGSARNFAREYELRMKTEFALLQSRADLEALARTDALTGLSNRREYVDVFSRTWNQSRRDRAPLALLIFDLDHFKRINDRHGHLVGDDCLRHFATLLRESFRRDADFIGRIGGEEFVAVLPSCTAAEAVHLAEAFRLHVERTPCRRGADTVTVTTSVGVGELESADSDPDATFSRVDAACYAAKEQGRNRVVAA